MILPFINPRHFVQDVFDMIFKIMHCDIVTNQLSRLFLSEPLIVRISLNLSGEKVVFVMQLKDT